MSAVRMGMLRLVLGAAVGCATVALPMPGPVLLPFTSLIGSKMPLIALRRAAKRRLSAIDADIPQLLDLMAVASSAGMSAPMGLRRSAATINGPLAEEIAAVAAQVDLGTRWRDALSQMSDLLQLPDLSRMVAVIARTETLGVSLSESTRELASVVRHTRRASTMARARTAPVKMLFPLVFLVLPAFLLLTVVPVLLTTLRSVH